MASLTPGLSFRPDLSRVARLANDVKNSMQTPVRIALAAAHEEMAERVQDYAADELKRVKSSRSQRERGDGAMERAIRSEGNRDANSRGWTIGIKSYLDRSPARLYYRRIEEGGPNPMAAEGRIVGMFFGPGGPHAPNPSGGTHGRLRWNHSGTIWSAGAERSAGGFTVDAVDRAYRGYHVHENAGRWFNQGRMPVTAYKKAFDSVGINFVKLYELGYGARPTNAVIRGG